MKPILLFSLLLFVYKSECLLAKNSDFKSYYRQINEAEEDFINNKVPECFKKYDKVFKEYKQPFAKDCYIAAQIAYANGDTVRFINYLCVAFKSGMPIGALTAAPMLVNLSSLNSHLYSTILEKYAATWQCSNVNPANTDSLKNIEYRCDSYKVAFSNSRFRDTAMAVAFVREEEYFRSFVFRKYIRSGIFPSEKITGIKTDTTDEHFLKEAGKVDLYPKDMMSGMFGGANGMKVNAQAITAEYAMSNTLAFNIFIHSTCAMTEFADDLWKCVLNGYLHPKDYGLLEETCVSWNLTGPFSKYTRTCNYIKKDAYYNILPADPRKVTTFVGDPELLVKVEKNREEHLIQKYSVDVQKKKLEKEKGYKFFFGFLDFR